MGFRNNSSSLHNPRPPPQAVSRQPPTPPHPSLIASSSLNCLSSKFLILSPPSLFLPPHSNPPSPLTPHFHLASSLSLLSSFQPLHPGAAVEEQALASTWGAAEAAEPSRRARDGRGEAALGAAVGGGGARHGGGERGMAARGAWPPCPARPPPPPPSPPGRRGSLRAAGAWAVGRAGTSVRGGRPCSRIACAARAQMRTAPARAAASAAARWRGGVPRAGGSSAVSADVTRSELKRAPCGRRGNGVECLCVSVFQQRHAA